ncbi:MAG: hypothetical protein RR140_03210 [Clostridia bacterium]
MNEAKFRKFVSVCAFVAVVSVACALVLQMIISNNENVSNIIRIIGESIAYAVVCLVAYNFVATMRKPILSIIYAICVTVITVLIILR